jgi:hypothetical protein
MLGVDEDAIAAPPIHLHFALICWNLAEIELLSSPLGDASRRSGHCAKFNVIFRTAAAAASKQLLLWHRGALPRHGSLASQCLARIQHEALVILRRVSKNYK